MIEILGLHLIATTVLCAGAVLHDPEQEPGEMFTLAICWPFLAWAAFVYHLAAGMAWVASKWKGIET